MTSSMHGIAQTANYRRHSTYESDESAKPAQWAVFATKMRQTFTKRSTGLNPWGAAQTLSFAPDNYFGELFHNCGDGSTKSKLQISKGCPGVYFEIVLCVQGAQLFLFMNLTDSLNLIGDVRHGRTKIISTKPPAAKPTGGIFGGQYMAPDPGFRMLPSIASFRTVL